MSAEPKPQMDIDFFAFTLAPGDAELAALPGDDSDRALSGCGRLHRDASHGRRCKRPRDCMACLIASSRIGETRLPASAFLSVRGSTFAATHTSLRRWAPNLVAVSLCILRALARQPNGKPGVPTLSSRRNTFADHPAFLRLACLEEP